jgi:hypothetical protein
MQSASDEVGSNASGSCDWNIGCLKGASMEEKEHNTNSKRKKWPWVLLGVTVLLVATVLFFRLPEKTQGVPILTIETPHKLSASQKEEFTLDVRISALGEDLYPAMSMSVGFDQSRLEFLGLEEGNVFVLSSESKNGKQLPFWNCNVQASNDVGLINIMYLDITGGKHAFSEALQEGEEHILLRLSFRLRGSACVGDVLDLSIEDAVFAATDESRSLAMINDTLATQNGRLVIGE